MSLASFDLNLLLVLDTVLAEGSVAKAARRLHVTPSAISNALARLRVLVGDPLVTRRGRGIVPTPRALELGPVIAKSLRELREAVRTGQFNPALTTRRFTIALSDAGQIALLPRIAAGFAREMPLAKLRSLGIDSLLLLGGLPGPEVDLVIGPEASGADIHTELLFDQETVLICRQGHPALASRKGATAARRQAAATADRTPEKGAALRHIAIEMAPGQGLRDMAGAAYAQAGVERNVVLTVPTFSAAAAVVAETDLVATVPASIFEAVGSLLRLRTLPFPIPKLMIATNLLWHERTHADPAAVAFREIVRRAVVAARSGARPRRPGTVRDRGAVRR